MGLCDEMLCFDVLAGYFNGIISMVDDGLFEAPCTRRASGIASLRATFMMKGRRSNDSIEPLLSCQNEWSIYFEE